MDDVERQEFMSAVDPVLDGLFGAALRLTGRRSDAEDLVQDVLLRAFQAWHRFVPGTHVRAWLHKILMNTYISNYRRRVREHRALDVSADPGKRELLITSAQAALEADEGGVHCHGFGRTVQTALDALPPEFRTVVIMADVAELTYREIADALECPIGTVMSRLHRARRALANSLGSALSAPVLVALQDSAAA